MYVLFETIKKLFFKIIFSKPTTDLKMFKKCSQYSLLVFDLKNFY